MSAWEDIADARIRAWLALPPDDRPPAPAQTPGLPLEVQLFDDVRALDALSEAEPEPDAAAMLRREANALMLRLMVLLEGQGRPLAARHYREARREKAERDDPEGV